MSEIEARLHGGSGFALDVDLRVPARGVTALFGQSGCGKTTTLRRIAGLQRVRGDYLRVNGEVWQDTTRFVPPHKRAIGYVFQEASLFAHLNVRGNLEYGLRRTPPAQRRVAFDEAVALLGLETLLPRNAERLSGGQRQRVAIARALLTSPQLLLMDEPLAALDAASKADILPWLETLTRRLDVPVIYVSHAAAEVQRFADHMALMEAGRVVASGPLNALLTRPDLPLAHLDEAGAVLDAQIKAHDDEYHLTFAAVPGGQFAVSRRELPLGHPVRLRILARDVSLALDAPLRTSITNVLPVRIAAIGSDRDPAQALVQIDLGGQPLLARLTKRSVAMLELKIDQIVYAQVKSVALMD